MTHSMTAFARVEVREAFGDLVWELRTVNHRFLEVFARIPEDLRALESMVRERASKRLGRGKLDATLRYKPSGEVASPMRLNEGALARLIELSDRLRETLPRAAPLAQADILGWPGMVMPEEVDLSPVQESAVGLLERGLDELIAARRREGVQLADTVRRRCSAMLEHVEAVLTRMPLVLEGIRQRLSQRLAEVTDSLDEGRLEQELVLLAQRLDVDEELDRLRTHLAEVERLLDDAKPVGRRLDFLMQELNREANTITSKSSDAQTTRHAVEMKVLIEQMREQVQNIE
jgi:uncharacterized protein (TIGR00255 family)